MNIVLYTEISKPFLRNGQNIKAENQRGHSWTQQHHHTTAQQRHQCMTSRVQSLLGFTGILTKVDHILSYKTHCSTFKEI